MISWRAGPRYSSEHSSLMVACTVWTVCFLVTNFTMVQLLSTMSLDNSGGVEAEKVSGRHQTAKKYKNEIFLAHKCTFCLWSKWVNFRYRHLKTRRISKLLERSCKSNRARSCISMQTMNYATGWCQIVFRDFTERFLINHATRAVES